MKDIFAELYNKVLSFFNKTDEKAENAKDVACNRLKLVLMQDRTNLTPAIMDRMRKELIELLSKYMELDRELLDLNFEHEDEQMALMLSIPVIRAKNEDEIQEILDREDEERQKLNELLGNDDTEDDDDDAEEDDDELSEDEDDNESESDKVISVKEQKKEKFFKEKKGSNSDNNENTENIEAEQNSDDSDDSENDDAKDVKIEADEESDDLADEEIIEDNESVK